LTTVVPKPTMKFLAIAAITATLVFEVGAHTRVYSVWVDGSDLGQGEGHYIRFPLSDGPVMDVTSTKLTCNDNGFNPVPEYAPVPAGHTVSTEWCT